MADDDPRIAEAARLTAEGAYDQAVELLFAAWSANRSNRDLAVSYACLLARVGREDEAEQLFASLSLESPEDGRVWNNWGYLLLEKGDLAGAILRLEKALHLAPDDFEALINLGIALDRNGRTAESLEAYRRAADTNPASPVAFNNLGTAQWRAGRRDEALEAFRTALRLDSRDASAANNMGIIKMADDELEEAASYFRQALQLDPDSLAARRNLAAAEDKLHKAAPPPATKEKKCEKPPSLF